MAPLVTFLGVVISADSSFKYSYNHNRSQVTCKVGDTKCGSRFEFRNPLPLNLTAS